MGTREAVRNYYDRYGVSLDVAKFTLRRGVLVGFIPDNRGQPI